MQVKLTAIWIPEPIRFGTGNLNEMKETLKNYGMIHPIAVKPIRNFPSERLDSLKVPVSNGSKKLTESTHPKYELVAGFLRYKAAEELGWQEVPVTVIQPQDELNQFDIRVEENMKRRELNPLEICELLIQRKRLWEEKNGKIKNGRPTDDGKLSTNVESFYEETGRIFRRCKTDIYTFLQLKELDPDLKVKVEAGEMWYRKALEVHGERHCKDKKKKSKKRGPRLPQPPIDLNWLSHDFQKTFWQMGGFYESVMLVKERPMILTDMPEDLVGGLLSMSATIQEWLRSFDTQVQEVMLERMGLKEKV